MASLQRKKIWTTKRKLLGNLLPFIIAAPFFALALDYYYKHAESTNFHVPVETGILIILFIVVCWLGINIFGYFQNDQMQAAIGRNLDSQRGPKVQKKYFVGIATPTFRSILDPHEDVGFLIFHDDFLEFYGESQTVRLERADITKVSKKPNIHSIAFIGGWVTVEGVFGGKPGKLLVEPRVKSFVIANQAIRTRLVQEIEEWRSLNAPHNDAAQEETLEPQKEDKHRD